ncbi:D-alanyl-D-alanine carboxypeptidase family protein [Microbacterium oleivorans]|uniref:D-alanyl-D-alanine carboxypeptidase family protein n=1 Tax=Microbacterium TaxID=33882 RepID=UPI0033F99F44
MIGPADAGGAPLERLGERRGDRGIHPLPAVLDDEDGRVVVAVRRDRLGEPTADTASPWTASTRATEDGLTLRIDSGWRSPEYQERLLQDAVAKCGSREEASRWVATPETSAHVSGDAVDPVRARLGWHA